MTDITIEKRHYNPANDPRTVISKNTVFKHCSFRDLDLRNIPASHSLFEGCTFEQIDFSGANFSSCRFTGCSFTKCSLSKVNLYSAVIDHVDCTDTNFYAADLENSTINQTTFEDCALCFSIMRHASMNFPHFLRCDLAYAEISEVAISSAEFLRCDLSNAVLENTSLADVNLSGSFGLISPSDWLRDQFESDAQGILVYKSLEAMHTSHWGDVVPGMILSETVNPDRTASCGCGVNFGTLIYVQTNYPENLWLCRIRWEWLPEVIVPYNTDGKARCGKLELIRCLS